MSKKMQTNYNKSLVGACPECDADIYFTKRPYNGQAVTCNVCKTELVVIGNNPIELDWAFAIELESDLDDDYTYD